jgi:hypothetical protein
VDPSRGEIGDRRVSSGDRPSCRARYGGSWKNVSLLSSSAPSIGDLGEIGDTLLFAGSLPFTIVISDGDIGENVRGASCNVGDKLGVLGSTPLYIRSLTTMDSFSES